MQILPSESWKSSEFISKGYKLLNEVEEYLWEIKMNKHFGFYRMETLEPEVLDLADLFINDKINEESLKTRLNILAPLVEQRFIKRNITSG